MQKDEYLKLLLKSQIDNEKVQVIEALYKMELPEKVKKIISNCKENIFLDGKRVLSFKEIENAEMELHVDFIDRCLIPLVDCMDNDFIVYDLKNRDWSMFNIIEKCVFKKRDSFEKVLE